MRWLILCLTISITLSLTHCAQEDTESAAFALRKDKRDLSVPPDLTVIYDMSPPRDLVSCGAIYEPCCGDEQTCDAGLIPTYRCGGTILDSGYCLGVCDCEPPF